MIIIGQTIKRGHYMYNYSKFYREQFELFFKEDDTFKNFHYLNSLPETTVNCSLKVKDDLVLSGLAFFFETFNFISKDEFNFKEFLEFEGKEFSKSDNFEINFSLPFNIALTGERLALNLVQRASSISTYTKKYVDIAGRIAILDTRKTTPGLRFLEKYAVNIGGGYNHRYSQMDAWMVKDNHKAIFGGVDKAIEFFKKQNSFYHNIIVEIHDLEELEIAYNSGAKHFLLDNFSPSEIIEASKIKKQDMTYEVSGGVNLNNLNSYCLDGVDAISSGSLTYDAPQVDLSLKFNHE